MQGQRGSDNGRRRLVKARDLIRLHRGPGSENGQATTEFALILFPLLILVAGIIQFGIALNFWLDMQRIANQGARWAAVNNWPPDCPLGSPSCGTPNTLQESLTRQALSNGLRGNVSVSVCYPQKTPATVQVGDPVKVRLTSPFTFLPVLGIGQITLQANATMRLEQKPTLIQGATGC